MSGAQAQLIRSIFIYSSVGQEASLLDCHTTTDSPPAVGSSFFAQESAVAGVGSLFCIQGSLASVTVVAWQFQKIIAWGKLCATCFKTPSMY